MGRWSDNYNSWKNYKSNQDRKFIFIKYENLVSNTKETVFKNFKIFE